MAQRDNKKKEICPSCKSDQVDTYDFRGEKIKHCTKCSREWKKIKNKKGRGQ